MVRVPEELPNHLCYLHVQLTHVVEAGAVEESTVCWTLAAHHKHHGDHLVRELVEPVHQG